MKTVTEEEILRWKKFAEESLKKDREIAATMENGIASADLLKMLGFSKIICGGLVMECVEIHCVDSKGTQWRPKNFAAAIREHYKEAKE